MSFYNEKSDFNTSFMNNWIELKTEFLNLRACYWFFSSLMKKGSAELVDVFIARIAFSNLYQRQRAENFPFEAVEEYLMNDDECSPMFWEEFLDLVSRFYKRLSLAKYSIINLGGFFIIEIGFQNNILIFL